MWKAVTAISCSGIHKLSGVSYMTWTSTQLQMTPGVSISEQLDVLREQLVEERMQRQATAESPAGHIWGFPKSE